MGEGIFMSDTASTENELKYFSTGGGPVPVHCGKCGARLFAVWSEDKTFLGVNAEGESGLHTCKGRNRFVFLDKEQLEFDWDAAQ